MNAMYSIAHRTLLRRIADGIEVTKGDGEVSLGLRLTKEDTGEGAERTRLDAVGAKIGRDLRERENVVRHSQRGNDGWNVGGESRFNERALSRMNRCVECANDDAGVSGKFFAERGDFR